jgi:predicted AlkP superfamily pyrophosphatase or phosphodiesterase
LNVYNAKKTFISFEDEIYDANKDIHIVLIGLDGWGAYSLPEAEMPVVKKMMQKGSYTLEALDIMPSSSACNWASMFMGADPKLHGYSQSGSKAPDFEPAVLDSYGFFPNIFSLLKEQRPSAKIGYFYDWEGMKYLCPDDALDRMERKPKLSYDLEAVFDVALYIKKQKPTLLFTYFAGPDSIGHRTGFDSSEYYNRLMEIDYYIGIIEKAVIEAGIYENTVFILSSDHGGIGKGHGGDTPLERQIPVILYGKNIKQNYEIASQVMIYDIAPTIAHIFKLDIPDIWIGKTLLDIFIEESALIAQGSVLQSFVMDGIVKKIKIRS